MWLEIDKLEDDFLQLERLKHQHSHEIAEAVSDQDAEQLWFTSIPTKAKAATYVEKALSAKDQICFVVRLKETGELVGSTRFYDIKAEHKRAMIGYTWYLEPARRTSVNTRCKLLLLQHLFESNQAIAVELQTHFMNQASRAAIERLGAKQDGILRNHQIMPDGSLRDTVCYSIIQSEWPAVRNQLQAKLLKYATLESRLGG